MSINLHNLSGLVYNMVPLCQDRIFVDKKPFACVGMQGSVAELGRDCSLLASGRELMPLLLAMNGLGSSY